MLVPDPTAGSDSIHSECKSECGNDEESLVPTNPFNRPATKRSEVLEKKKSLALEAVRSFGF